MECYFTELSQNSISKEYKFSRRSNQRSVCHCQIRSCIHEYARKLSYKPDATGRYPLHIPFWGDQQRDKRCRNRRREKIRSGRIRRNGSATRELHKPVQASLYDPKPRPLSFRAKLIHRTLSPHNLFPLAPLNYDNRWKSIVKFDRHLIRKNLKVPFPFLTIFHFYISHVMAAWHVTSVGP